MVFPGNHGTPRPGRVLSTFNALCRLAVILEKVPFIPVCLRLITVAHTFTR